MDACGAQGDIDPVTFSDDLACATTRDLARIELLVIVFLAPVLATEARHRLAQVSMM